MKVCRTCGYRTDDNSETTCPICDSINNFVDEDIEILEKISNDKAFIDAMIDLHDKDIIEYELKMSQFRTQVQQQKQVESARKDSNVPHCPHCNSTNIRPITTGSRLLSTTLFGFASRKMGKSYECLSCKYTW